MTFKTEFFFRQHPIFTRYAFEQAIAEGRDKNENTIKNVLAHHLKQGHIVRIKRGLFASIPYGADASTYPINPYLITGRLSDDAVIGYHTALSYYGTAYSSSYRFLYLTKSKPKPFEFRGIAYQASLFPTPLALHNQTHCYVNREDIQGIDILVTSKERTLVDVIDRPFLGGGWEEIWRSLDMMEQLKIQNVVDYTLMLGVAMTVAKVGFYLEQRKKDINVDEAQLERLEKHSPASPCYIDGVSKNKCVLIRRWNLMVPELLINRNWEDELNWEPKS